MKSSYVDYARLGRALALARADAAWVGWGFVAEHAAFADLCREIGIVFIGPDGDVMRLLGDKIVEQLVEQELVRSPADLYRLDLPTLEALERMGEKSARNLLDSIERSRRADLARFVYALGVPGVGEEVAKILARHFGSLDALLDADWAKLSSEKETIRKENARRKKKGEPAEPVPLTGIVK